MMALLNSLHAHNFSIFQPILMILVSKFMVHRALSDKTYLSLGLLSPLFLLCSKVLFAFQCRDLSFPFLNKSFLKHIASCQAPCLYCIYNIVKLSCFLKE